MKRPCLPRALNLTLAVVLCLPAAGPAWAGPASDLADLVGAKGAGAEADMERRGYTHIDTHKSSHASFSYWWNNAKAACVRVTTGDGRYKSIVDADASDCGQTKRESGMSDGAKVAVGAAALLGIVALAHKSHHRDDDRSYNEEQTAEFERGYRDGLYNHSFHNYSNSSEYSSGYSKGSEERNENSRYRNGYGYSNYGPRWERCADEGSYCSFRGAGVVRFGADGRFLTRRGFNGMGCDSRTFGDDPAYGKRKQCFVRKD